MEMSIIRREQHWYLEIKSKTMHYPEYDIVERYPADKTIGFTSTAAEWGLLSNFAKTPMVVEGVEFVCVEQMFHYIRLNSEIERTPCHKGQAPYQRRRSRRRKRCNRRITHTPHRI